MASIKAVNKNSSSSAKLIANKVLKSINPEVPSYAKHLLSSNTSLQQQEFSFELHGVNIAIANGIRRVIESGVPVKCFNVSPDDIESNDPYVIPEYIVQRIRLIPCKQTININSGFGLDYINNGYDIQEVMTAEIKYGGLIAEKSEKRGGSLPDSNDKSPQTETSLKSGAAENSNLFDGTIALTDLNPNCFLRIKNIRVVWGRGYDYGGFTVAHGCVCLPLWAANQAPYSISSSCSDIRDHLIRFQTNGTEPPPSIVKRACSEIISRLKSAETKLATNLHTRDSETDHVHRLVIEGEDDTIGNILMKTILDIEPEISACVYTVNNIDRNMHLELRHMEPKHLIMKAIHDSVNLLGDIAKQIE